MCWRVNSLICLHGKITMWPVAMGQYWRWSLKETYGCNIVSVYNNGCPGVIMESYHFYSLFLKVAEWIVSSSDKTKYLPFLNLNLNWGFGKPLLILLLSGSLNPMCNVPIRFLAVDSIVECSRKFVDRSCSFFCIQQNCPCILLMCYSWRFLDLKRRWWTLRLLSLHLTSLSFHHLLLRSMCLYD